jgi:hypothetical protein
MNCGLFGVRFSVFKHKKGAAAPIDYSSIFATAPIFMCLKDKNTVIMLCCLTVHYQ